MKLKIENISVVRQKQILVNDVSFTLKTGEMTILLGPNGAGKTSLMKAALNIDLPSSGRVILKGQDISGMTPQARAQCVTYLPQSTPLAWPSRVRDIVALGRFAYGANPAKLGAVDAAAVDAAIAACDLGALETRRADTLSGGEQARMHFARCFAAQTPFLFADEPVAALDPYHQFNCLDLIRDYVNQGNGAFVILHNIALAARYADRLLWMKDGHIIKDGSPEDTLTPQRLQDIYGIKAEISGREVKLIGPETRT